MYWLQWDCGLEEGTEVIQWGLGHRHSSDVWDPPSNEAIWLRDWELWTREWRNHQCLCSCSHARVDWQETEDAHVFSNACSLYYVRTPRMKQSETAAVGCFVGLCALISPFCDFAKALVSNLQALCNNGRRGEERGREGASRRGEQKSMRHRVETRRGSFVRRFRLPENAKLEKINSGLDHGVLTLTKTNVQETPRNVRHIDVA